MSTNEELSKNYSGIFGNRVVLKSRKGRSYMTIPETKPAKNPTTAQDEYRKKFANAARYAKNVLSDPEMQAMYAAKALNRKSAYNLAVADYLQPPRVEQIDVSAYFGNRGDKISVEAYDDFAVKQVEVKIVDAENATVETGTCEMNLSSGYYEYTATIAIPDLTGVTIIAEVTDYPAHKTTLSMNL